MRQRFATSLRTTVLSLGLLALAACVTINVYFPAAEAQQAAEEFIDKVIGDDGKPQSSIVSPETDFPMAVLSFFVGNAQAQSADISIRTPAIQAIQTRMATRFQDQLLAHFESGALGFGNDGLVVLREAGKIGLKDRVSVNQWLAEDNRDRNAVYREIAVANNHPEWEGQIRDTFAKQWISSARAGWWYQAGDGSWKQK